MGRRYDIEKIEWYDYFSNELLGTFDTLKEAEMVTGITVGSISQCARGKIKKLYNSYYFRYRLREGA